MDAPLSSLPPHVSSLPRHVAIIMDGNGRWAKARFLPRVEGHRQGAKTVRTIVEECGKLGIRYLTLYAFSTENWKRPEEEVGALMKLFVHYLEGEVEHLKKNGVRLRAIGERSRLPASVQETLRHCEDATASQTRLDLILAVSYGSRDEIASACKKIAQLVVDKGLTVDQITTDVISQHLYAPDVPDPDLLIRTSSEIRISNFLLWQLAYAEIVVSPLYWPEFSQDEFRRCLAEFGKRERRYGLTGEQIKGR